MARITIKQLQEELEKEKKQNNQLTAAHHHMIDVFDAELEKLKENAHEFKRELSQLRAKLDISEFQNNALIIQHKRDVNVIAAIIVLGTVLISIFAFNAI